MIFWLLAVTITVIACAALYYAAAGRGVNAAGLTAAQGTDAHFRLQLGELEGDIASGRVPASEAVAAKAELAREFLRQQREAAGAAPPRTIASAVVMPTAVGAVALIAFAAYAVVGNPGLPSQPLAGRQDAQAQNVDVADALKQIEARLKQHPEDLRGWTVIAPVYMQTGRYAEAEHAFRQILSLSPPSADNQTNLAEALMMERGGEATGEAVELLNRVAAAKPADVRSRYYLAAAAMRSNDFASAVAQWTAVIALGKGDEPWMATAKAGLAAAEAGRDGKPLPAASAPAPSTGAAQSPAILAMVSGLAARLSKDGGPLADWTRLVRSEIVLGDLAKAQSAYDAARKAYPDAGARAELDGLAAQAGLKLDGTTP